MNETSIDVIENIFKDLRQSFNNGKTKSISWRKKQIEQLYKMCDEQKVVFASAVNVDFHRPNFETLLFDCGSVSIHSNDFCLFFDLFRFVTNVLMLLIISMNGQVMKKYLMHLLLQH